MSSPLSSALVAQDAGVADQSRKEFEARLGALGGLGGKNISPEAKAQKLREACEGFESIFIQKMWQEMRNTIPKGGMLQGREERFWQDMYDQELSKSMSKAGGIGLADMMFEQLSRNLGDASRTAAQGATGGAFVPTAVPLMPSPAVYTQMLEPEATGQLVTESVYEQEAPEAGSVAGELGGDSDAVVLAETADKPVAQPVAAAAAPLTAHPAEAKVTAKKPVHHTVQPGSRSDRNGLDLAYMAGRDAGDKLGSGAVRPAMRPRKDTPHPKAEAPAEPTVAPAQGTPEALQAALLAARANTSSQGDPAGRSLSSIVAEVQSRQAAASTQAAAETVTQATQTAASAPTVRKVRYTTNIPQSGSNKKGDQAIRLLNVDKVGANSKAGQGLQEYHAAQEAQAAGSIQAQVAPASQLTQAAALIESGRKPEQDANATFAIPPLRAGSL